MKGLKTSWTAVQAGHTIVTYESSHTRKNSKERTTILFDFSKKLYIYKLV